MGWKMRFELTTSGATNQRSNQLSYIHHCFLAGVAGFEPTHARVKVWCLTAWLHPLASIILSCFETFVNKNHQIFYLFLIFLLHSNLVSDILVKLVYLKEIYYDK